MAPNSFDQTTLDTPRVRYTSSTASSGWDNTPTNCTSTSSEWDDDHYYVSVVSRVDEAKVKKLIKKNDG